MSTATEMAAAIGARIREEREYLGWSQMDLANRIIRTQTAVSYWESGKRLISLDDLFKVALTFGISAATILADAETKLMADGWERARPIDHGVSTGATHTGDH